MNDKVRELIAENDYLRTVINSANEGIYVTDRERRFLIWNDAAERICGFSREEVIGNYCFDNILDHIDGKGVNLCWNACPLQRAMETGTPQGPETVYLRHKKGHRVPVEVRTAPLFDKNGTVTGSIEVFQDISDRIEKEKVLGERTKKLETVMDNICDGVLFVDHEGNISLFNKALSEMLSVGNDLLGLNIFSLPSDNPLKDSIFRVDRRFEGPFCWETFDCAEEMDCSQKGVRNGRCWLRQFPGPRRRTLCCECPAFTEMRRFLEQPKELVIGPRVFSVLSSFIELREKNRILEVIVFKEVTSEKLGAVMALAGAAAHELRQPLQVIVNCLGMLKDELHDAERMDGYSEAIEESCLRMDGIIKKLLKVTQYKVKEYSGNIRILDIAKSSETSGRETDDT